MATFDLGNKIKIVSKTANIDNNYGPYLGTTTAQALALAHTTVNGFNLVTKGVTVGIIVNSGNIEEYWYESIAVAGSPTVADLKKKGTSDSVRKTDYTVENILVGGSALGTPTSVTLTSDTVLGKVSDNTISTIKIIGDIANVSDSNNQLIYAKTIKNYVDTNSSSPQVFQGGYDATNNNPMLDNLAPDNEVLKGWTYIVTVAGNLFTKQVYIGDHLVANQNSPTLINHWTVVENGLQAASTSIAGIVELATNEEVKTGSLTNLAVTPSALKNLLGISETLSIPRKFTTPILSTTPTGKSATMAYTHNLGTRDAMVMIRQLAFPYQEVDADIEFTTDY